MAESLGVEYGIVVKVLVEFGAKAVEFLGMSGKVES